MSDSLAFLNKIITRGEIEYPRYADLMKPKEKVEEQSSEEIIHKFDSLRRKE